MSDVPVPLVPAVRSWTGMAKVHGDGGCVVVAPWVRVCGARHRWTDGSLPLPVPRWSVARVSPPNPRQVDPDQFVMVAVGTGGGRDGRTVLTGRRLGHRPSWSWLGLAPSGGLPPGHIRSTDVSHRSEGALVAGARRSGVDRKAAVEAALEVELDRIVESGEFAAWFEKQAAFHRYSPTNSMWILAQRPAL